MVTTLDTHDGSAAEDDDVRGTGDLEGRESLGRQRVGLGDSHRHGLCVRQCAATESVGEVLTCGQHCRGRRRGATVSDDQPSRDVAVRATEAVHGVLGRQCGFLRGADDAGAADDPDVLGATSRDLRQQR